MAARLKADEYRDGRTPTSLETWECFDTTTYRLLHTILEPVRLDGRPGTLPLHDLAGPALLPEAFAARDAQCRPLRPRDGEPSGGLGEQRMRAGELPARREPGGYAVSITAIPARTDVHPADPLDPNPLARLSCRLGALGDLLAQAPQRAGRERLLRGFPPRRAPGGAHIDRARGRGLRRTVGRHRQPPRRRRPAPGRRAVRHRSHRHPRPPQRGPSDRSPTSHPAPPRPCPGR